MVKKSRCLMVGAVLSALIGSVMVVSADGVIKNITAQINSNIKMEVAGDRFSPKDANGKLIQPISYLGSTYLPVRALGEALGVVVDYDSKTQTVIIGEGSNNGEPKSEWTNLSPEVVKPNMDNDRYLRYTNSGNQLKTGASVYGNGLIATKLSGTKKTSIQTKGKYTTMSFVAWAEDEDRVVLSIKDKGTGEVYDTFKLTGDPQLLEVVIDKSKEVEVSYNAPVIVDKGRVVMGDIKFK